MKVTREQIESVLKDAIEEPLHNGKTRYANIGPLHFRLAWFPNREFGVVGVVAIDRTRISLTTECRTEKEALTVMYEWVNHLQADVLQEVVDYLRS